MRNRRMVESTTALVLFIAMVVGPVKAYASIVHLTLTRTTGLIAVADAAGSTLHEGGTVANVGGSVIGQYVLTIRTVTRITEQQNAGIVTITLLGIGPSPPPNVALTGAHYFSPGNEIGGIGGSSIPGLTGITWDLIPLGIGVYRLNLNTP